MVIAYWQELQNVLYVNNKVVAVTLSYLYYINLDTGELENF